MERYEEIKKEYFEFYQQSLAIQKERMEPLFDEWRTVGLKSVGLIVGDIVEYNGERFAVVGMDSNPINTVHYVNCSPIDDEKREGMIFSIRGLSAEHKVEA